MKKLYIFITLFLLLATTQAQINTALPVGSIPGSADVSYTGAAIYTLPIEIPPGIQGLQPHLAITYNSNGGDGIMGRGWSLSGISYISREGKDIFHDLSQTGVQMDYYDCFSWDGQRLMRRSDGTYCTMSETLAKIFPKYENGKLVWFEIQTKDGKTLEYGKTSNSRIETASGTPEYVYKYYLSKVTDANGNTITYEYNSNGVKERMISQIEYTQNAAHSGQSGGDAPVKITFTYAARDYQIPFYVVGNQILPYNLLKSIKIYGEIGNGGMPTDQTTGSGLLRNYEFKYKKAGYLEQDGIYTLLDTIKLAGRDGKYLNPTYFTYYAASTQPTMPLGQPRGSDYFNYNEARYRMDVNGDGKDDLIDRNGYVVLNGPYHDPQIDPQYRIPYFNAADNTLAGATADLNGDGNSDFLGIEWYPTPTGGALVKMYVCLAKTSGNGFERQIIAVNDLPHIFSHVVNIRIDVGDFNADGLPEFWVQRVHLDTYSNKEITEHFIIDKSGLVFTKTEEGAIGFTLHTNAVVDIDGDGKDELLLVRIKDLDQIVTITSYKNNTITHDQITLKDQQNNPVNFYNTYPGDFNGDGKTDLLVYSGTGQSWSLFHSDGKKWIPFTASLPMRAINTHPKPYNFVADINSDGMDDFIQLSFLGNATSMSIEAYYSTGCGFKKKIYYDNPINAGGGTPLSVAALNPGDYNGDGFMEFFCKLDCGNGTFKFAYFNPFKSEAKPFLKTVVNGTGHTSKFEYTTLADDGMYLNSKTELDDGFSLLTNAPVVKTLNTSNGLGGFNQQTFKYKNGLRNYYYGGFMGFEVVIARDNTTQIKNKSQYTYFEFQPNPFRMETYYSPGCQNGEVDTAWDSCGKYDTLIHGEYHKYYNLSLIENLLRIRYYSLILDYLNECRTEIIDSCNQYGNITYRKTEHLWGTSSKIGSVTRNRYVSKGNYGIPNKLEYSQTTATYPNQPAFVSDTAFVYDIKGNLTGKTSFPNKSGTLSTLFTNFTAQGLPCRITTQTAGLQDRYQTLEYSGRGRFVSKITDMNNRTVKTFYDPYGNVTQTTDVMGNPTTYEYDGFGRLKRTITPIDTTQIQWYWGQGDGPANTNYYILITGSNKPPVTVYYDLLGRELRSKTYNFRNNAVMVDIEYNAKGQLYRQSRPYYAGETKRWTTYLYDNYGRLISVNDNGLSTVTRYGKLAVTVTLPDGTQRSKTINPLEQTLSSTDNGGTVTYTYHSSGQPLTITTGGATTTMQYDDYARQIQLNDPNAGATNYNYNAYGELTYQSDARGNVTQLIYLSDGRLDYKNTSEGRHQYTYYDNGIFNTLLKRERAPNGNLFEYVYDSMGRTTQLTQHEFENYNNYVTQYTYDKHGNLATTTYPTGFKIKNRYDNYGYGYLVEISKDNSGGIYTNLGSGASIWRLDTVNAMGQVVRWIAGQTGTKPARTYDSYDLLTGITCDTLQNFSYEFKPENGNLLWREDNTRALSTETFSYDNLDRLTAVVSRKTPANLTVTYQDNGNIATKSDAGSYTYHGAKKHAVCYVTGSNDIPLTTQTATYTSFSSVKTLKEILPGNKPLEAKFSYAPDDQRIMMQVYNDNELQYTKVYANRFEQVTKGNNPYDLYKRRDFHYISAPGGARMVYVSHGDNVNTGTLFYLLTDHQGSITHVVNEWGGLALEYSYDAWGRRRDAGSLQPYAQSFFQTASNLAPLFIDGFCTFDRGYTGHEHLDAFGLINMNGRLYDPVMARMLSPDNFVQDPENSQSFNRYSYCLNNPLKYVDPTGEGWVEAPDGTVKWYSNITSLKEFKESGLEGTYFDAGSLYNPEGLLVDYYLNGDSYVHEPVVLPMAEVSANTPWKPIDYVQRGLDIAGFVPGYGEVADFINAMIYTYRGDLTNATISGVAMVPIWGWVATSGKLSSKVVKPSVKAFENKNWALKSWSLTKEGASAIKYHSEFGTIFKSKSDGLWWLIDRAGHGGSKFKVYKETTKGLEWYKDADELGNFIINKHKGNTGMFIPWGQLKTVK